VGAPKTAEGRIVTGMRIGTWNLLHAMAITGQAPGQVSNEGLAQAALLECDILAIQEVDSNQSRSNNSHQTQTIALATGLEHWCYAPALIGTPGESWNDATDEHIHRHFDSEIDSTARYGNGLLSRFPMRDIDVVRFAPSRFSMPLLIPGNPRPRIMKIADEPRVAIFATIETPSGDIHVATTHLSFVPGTNVRQLKETSRRLKERAGGSPAYLLGDFNLPGKIPARIVGMTSLAQLATYPTPNPKIQFDHILAQGLSQKVATEAFASARSLALDISDHRALTVDIRDE